MASTCQLLLHPQACIPMPAKINSPTPPSQSDDLPKPKSLSGLMSLVKKLVFSGPSLWLCGFAAASVSTECRCRVNSGKRTLLLHLPSCCAKETGCKAIQVGLGNLLATRLVCWECQRPHGDPMGGTAGLCTYGKQLYSAISASHLYA